MLFVALKLPPYHVHSSQDCMEQVITFHLGSLPSIGKLEHHGWISWWTSEIIIFLRSAGHSPLSLLFLTGLVSSPDRDQPKEYVAPITYNTLHTNHLPQVHDLLHRCFWPGVDGELNYPGSARN